ncbi:reverse transcriptase/maturase family protein [Virgisporangium aurantiacum]|uniref:Reverse transcriptase domain-containing protein n=1 Tax=Virgisporangium aurantiacum TaxID=175570 RepID=A0A8J3ZGU0_9ACTN|nr:reverse transcriptase/maturase family protein [Virgisporangium aurantiacum]GIJ63904.1 hypothetical protein Vau01_114200 [Virgisporangium aurantiacum]
MIADRCHQGRVRNALEPEWEARFEPRSYGFRPGRSCQDAAQAIFMTCKGPRAQRVWALDAELASAFDKIDHSRLLDTLGSFPARDMIRDWLKAGVFEAGKGFAPTEEGTPGHQPLPVHLARQHPPPPVRTPPRPLSWAETRKLVWRLPGLDSLTAEQQHRAYTDVGGHPRTLEYLDALLRHSKAKFADVTERIERLLTDHGVDDPQRWLTTLHTTDNADLAISMSRNCASMGAECRCRRYSAGSCPGTPTSHHRHRPPRRAKHRLDKLSCGLVPTNQLRVGEQ